MCDPQTSSLMGGFSNRKLPQIGDVPVRFTFIFTPAEGFVYGLFQFESGNYEKLRDAFVEKYGEPTSTKNRTIQNRMGASFEQEDLQWDGKNISAGLSRYGSTVTDGIGFVGLNTYIESSAKERKEKAKKSADDF